VDSAPHPQSSLPAFDVNSLKLDLCANTRKGRKRKAPEVDPGSKLRKECKSSEWKLFYEKWMNGDGLEAVLKTEVTLGYYLARVPVPFCRRCLFLYEIFLKPLQTGTGFYAF